MVDRSFKHGLRSFHACTSFLSMIERLASAHCFGIPRAPAKFGKYEPRTRKNSEWLEHGVTPKSNQTAVHTTEDSVESGIPTLPVLQVSAVLDSSAAEVSPTLRTCRTLRSIILMIRGCT
ncbi:hypothetical protein IQ07DRAFT_581699 [Pyrenochaeta sp. DS3sAY3a]|nr:hypothetical protein IQ07DRAFT_581699 [Pyrenochaeta sp. DS3sAY3a]